MTSSPADIAVPREGTLLGRYLLVRRLGQGGMGVVFEALDQDLGRRVAIKTLHERHALSRDVRQRFLREGQAASRVRHPNVANIFDVGCGDCPFLVMEFLEGEDLAQLLERETRLSVERAADLMVPVIAGVAAAHELGVVHRDLKPANIFVSAERNTLRPTVLDFGISKLADSTDGAGLTNSSMFLGTPHYVSPEQAQGTRDVDVRSDQYSLGVIVFQAVTGRRPVEGGALYSILLRIVAGDFPAPRTIHPGLPSALEAVILRAMARNPEARFSSTRAFGRALLEFASPAVRAAYESELSGDEELRANPEAPIEPRRTSSISVPSRREFQLPTLGTTLGESVHQLDSPARPRGGRRVFWLGALLVVPAGVWLSTRASGPNATQSAPLLNARVAAAQVASVGVSEPAPPEPRGATSDAFAVEQPVVAAQPTTNTASAQARVPRRPTRDPAPTAPSPSVSAARVTTAVGMSAAYAEQK